MTSSCFKEKSFNIRLKLERSFSSTRATSSRFPGDRRFPGSDSLCPQSAASCPCAAAPSTWARPEATEERTPGRWSFLLHRTETSPPQRQSLTGEKHLVLWELLLQIMGNIQDVIRVNLKHDKNQFFLETRSKQEERVKRRRHINSSWEHFWDQK